MTDQYDQYVIRCNSFFVASKYAEAMGWRLSQWAWLPAYTVQNNVQIFERIIDE